MFEKNYLYPIPIIKYYNIKYKYYLLYKISFLNTSLATEKK